MNRSLYRVQTRDYILMKNAKIMAKPKMSQTAFGLPISKLFLESFEEYLVYDWIAVGVQGFGQYLTFSNIDFSEIIESDENSQDFVVIKFAYNEHLVSHTLTPIDR
jgi:hypothetical protein